MLSTDRNVDEVQVQFPFLSQRIQLLFGPRFSQEAEEVLEHRKDSFLFNSTLQRKYSLDTVSVSVLQL